jgi:hypothetical protein
MLRILSCLLLVLSLPAFAQENWMDEQMMAKAFAGRTIDGRYSSGLTFTETYASDGRISYRDPTVTASGNWRVTAQGFCTFYDEMNGGCFLVRRLGTNCFEFYFSEGPDSGPLSPKEGKPYVAQGWYPEKPSTCVALST